MASNPSETTSAAPAAGEQVQQVQIDDSHIDPQANSSKLEKLLQNRTDAQTLQEQNILKNSTVAPALQAAQAELQKHRLEDKLEGSLERRPEREDLIRRGIIKETNLAPALQAKAAELERAQLEDKLEGVLGSRPEKDDLVKKGILQSDE
ncbi:hypothetical protein CF327_g5683 [Tilletia walkeri]|nr:hypothetical protein CF327_g5683 [Tilletia walkeri]